MLENVSHVLKKMFWKGLRPQPVGMIRESYNQKVISITKGFPNLIKT